MAQNETTKGVRVETKVIEGCTVTTYRLNEVDVTKCDGEDVMTLGIDNNLLQGTVQELRARLALANAALDRFEENTP